MLAGQLGVSSTGPSHDHQAREDRMTACQSAVYHHNSIASERA